MSGFKLEGAIFDLDGVIVNSVSLHFKAWKNTFSDYGKDFNFEDYKEKVDGIPTKDGARAILTNLSDEELNKVGRIKHDYYLDLLHHEGVEVYKDTVYLITKELKANKVKMAAISSSKLCRELLKAGEVYDLFEVIIGGNDIKKGKPDPEVFLTACSKMGLNPFSCVVFEDAVLGVEAGKKGGFFTVGVERYKNPQRLEEADLVVEDLSGLSFEKLNSMLKDKNKEIT